MKKIRGVPTGIFILAAILFLQGFNYMLAALLAVFYSIPTAIVDLIIGTFFIICASKLIRLQYQGWQLATIASVLYLLLALARIGFGGNLNAELTDAIVAGIIDAIIASILLIYLTRPKIKNIFRQ